MHSHSILTLHTRVLPRCTYNTFNIIVGIVVIVFIYSHMFTILIIVYDKFNRPLWLIVIFGAEQESPQLEALSTSPATVPLPKSPQSVSAVTVKILPYWLADPQVWFAQVKAQLTTGHISGQCYPL